MKKRASECSVRLDELTRFFHSAWSSWRHNWNTITEVYLLAFYWLAIFAYSLRSFGNDVRKNLTVLKSRDWFTISIYIGFVLECRRWDAKISLSLGIPDTVHRLHVHFKPFIIYFNFFSFSYYFLGFDFLTCQKRFIGTWFLVVKVSNLITRFHVAGEKFNSCW